MKKKKIPKGFSEAVAHKSSSLYFAVNKQNKLIHRGVGVYVGDAHYF